MMEKLLIFDLDCTLYKPVTGMMDAFDERIDTYLAKYVNIRTEDIQNVKIAYYEKYGLTGKGLEIEHNIDFMHYLSFVHAIELDEFLTKDEKLYSVLQSISNSKYVFTNSIKSYAMRVLNILGIADLFQDVFTLDSFHLINKPNQYPYTFLFKKLNAAPENCFYFEDCVENLIPAKKLGMTTVLVHNQCPSHCHHQVDYVLKDIYDLKSLL